MFSFYSHVYNSFDESDSEIADKRVQVLTYCIVTRFGKDFNLVTWRIVNLIANMYVHVSTLH